MATSWCGLAQGRACGRGTHPVSCMRKPCGREDGMPAEPTVSRAGHTAEDPRLPARRYRSSGCRHRPRAIAPVTGDGLSRGGTAGPGGIPRRRRAAGGGGRSRRRGRAGRARALPGRSPHGPEGHAPEGPGAQGNAPARRAGPPPRIRAPVLRRLPGDRGGGRACPREGQHRGDGPASPGDRGAGARWPACARRPRRGGPAPLQGPQGSGQRLPAPAAAAQPGAGPRRDGVPGPGAPPPPQPRVRKRRACQGDRRGGPDRLRRADGGDHADHRGRPGNRETIKATSMCDHLIVLVLYPARAWN